MQHSEKDIRAAYKKAEAIIEQMRNLPRVPDINACAVANYSTVREFETSGNQELKNMALRIRNFAAYRRKGLTEGWIK